MRAHRYQSASIVTKFAAHSAARGAPPARPWPKLAITRYTSADNTVKRAAIVVQSTAYHIHRVNVAIGIRTDVRTVVRDSGAAAGADVMVDVAARDGYGMCMLT